MSRLAFIKIRWISVDREIVRLSLKGQNPGRTKMILFPHSKSLSPA